MIVVAISVLGAKTWENPPPKKLIRSKRVQIVLVLYGTLSKKLNFQHTVEFQVELAFQNFEFVCSG